MKRTPLARRSPLKASTPLVRRTPVNPFSKKRVKQNAVRSAMRPSVPTPCAAQIPGVCWGLGQAFHEILSRARGGSITDSENMAWLCNPCNGYMDDHPNWAVENGWLKHSWEAR